MSLMTGKRAMTKAVFRKSYDTQTRYQRKLNRRQRKEVKNIMVRNTELKYYPSFFSTTASSTATLIASIFDVPQGVTDQNRIGDELTLVGLQFRIQTIVADTNNQVRFIIFQWHPNTGTGNPVPTDILLAGPSGNPDIYSLYNHDKRQDYKVLHDSLYTMNGNGTANYPITTSSIQFRQYNVSLSKARKKIHYIGGGLNATNRLWCIYLSDSIAIPHPQIIVATKLTFRDG